MRGFTLIAILAMLGCGGGSTGTDGGDVANDMQTEDVPGPDPMTACTQNATARCTKIDMCSNMTGVVRQYGSMSACVSRLTQNCLATLMAPMTTATPQGEINCATAIGSEACSDFRNGVAPSACIAPPGPIANGMPCVANGQCQSTVCLVPRNSLCGVCAAQPAAGDDCTLNASCGRVLVCNHNDTAGTYICRAPGTSGNSCDPDHPCGADLGCVVPAMGMTSGTCQALGTMLGTACNAGNVAVPTCDANDGLFCDNTNHCAMASTAMAGQSCGPMMSRMQDVFCIAGSSCLPPPSAMMPRTCVAPSMDGAACDTTNGPDCLAPSRCVLMSVGADAGTAGTCLAFDPTACH